MSLTRRAPKRDIRSLSVPQIVDQSRIAPTQPEATSSPEHPKLTNSGPGRDIRRILLSALPLFIALGVGSYLDTTSPWVTRFAEWLLKLGG